MENEFFGFVGRQDEIRLIEDIVNKVGSTDICLISGEGGVGKTWLLKQIHSLQSSFQDKVQVRLVVTDLIDLANQEMLIPLNLEHLIADEAGKGYYSARQAINGF